MSDDIDEAPILPESVGTPEPRPPERAAPCVAKPRMPSLELDAPPSASAPARASAEASEPLDIEAVVRQELALGDVVAPEGDPDAPALPLSPDEPPPHSSIDPGLLQPDAKLLSGLTRLAGAAADPDRARANLLAAIRGESYDVRALPDARALALGMARVLAHSGVSAEALADVIIAAMLE